MQLYKPTKERHDSLIPFLWAQPIVTVILIAGLIFLEGSLKSMACSFLLIFSMINALMSLRAHDDDKDREAVLTRQKIIIWVLAIVNIAIFIILP